MAKEVKRRKGTTSEHQNFTGAEAEWAYDTDKKTIVVHDGTNSKGLRALSTFLFPASTSGSVPVPGFNTNDGFISVVLYGTNNTNTSTLKTFSRVRINASISNDQTVAYSGSMLIPDPVSFT